MLKLPITYMDFEGVEVTEDYYFHLSKAELLEMELSTEGGLQKHLKSIIETMDGGVIIREFKRIILMSYGVRSHDGKRFIKNDELRNEFQQTEAYSALFMMLATQTDKAAEFINGLVPAGMAEDMAALIADQKEPELNLMPQAKTGIDEIDITKNLGGTATDSNPSNGPDAAAPAWLREDRDPTRKELVGMSKDEMVLAFRVRSERGKKLEDLIKESAVSQE